MKRSEKQEGSANRFRTTATTAPPMLHSLTFPKHANAKMHQCVPEFMAKFLLVVSVFLNLFSVRLFWSFYFSVVVVVDVAAAISAFNYVYHIGKTLRWIPADIVSSGLYTQYIRRSSMQIQAKSTAQSSF